MSKGEGKKIGIKFTENITSVVNALAQARVELKSGVTVSGTSTGSLANLLDGNLSNTWGHYSVSNFIQVDLQANLKDIKRFANGFKIHIGASSRPLNYVFSVSDNGTAYSNIKSGNIPQITGWHEFLLDAPVKTRFVRINFGYTSSFVINEFALLVGDKIGGFTVSGQEYKYVNGPLVDKNYVIENIANHPTVDKAILIEFNNFGRFSTVKDNLIVEYDTAIGTLAGVGGNIESFTHTFTPTDLIPEPNPGVIETITGAPTISINYLEVTYHKGYAAETITAAPAEITVAFLSTEVINP